MKTFVAVLFFFIGVTVINAQPGSSKETGQWITVSYPEPVSKRPCPIFRKTFMLPQNGVRSAVLRITALGVYEASINGQRVGADYFTPGFTAYNKRLQYQAYDVTVLLAQQNTIEVLLGDGWWRGKFRNRTSDMSGNHFGNELGLLAELTITYKDNRTETIGTGPGWQCRESGVRYSGFYDGECIDHRYIPGEWAAVRLLEDPGVALVRSISPPVRQQEHFKPVRIFTTPDGEQVADFGQNMAGWVKVVVKGEKGDTIRLQHAEVLDSAGNFFTANLRKARAEDVYVLSGNGEEAFAPHFTYHGFRYIKVTGMDIHRLGLEAVALYSPLPKTGHFACSNPFINQLQHNIEWSLNSNFLEIPTDCPQRDERLGWTGDAQVFAPTASYLRDTRLFFAKWLQDLALEQGANGAVPNFVPTSTPGLETNFGVAGWGDVATVVPWTLYQQYGDTTILRAQYASMKAWVDYIHIVSPDHLWANKGYGDWYTTGAATSLPFIDQCYYARSTQLLINAARVLEKMEDVTLYGKLLDSVKRAFVTTYGRFDRKDIQTQTAYALALVFDLVPETERSNVAELLVAAIHDNGNRLATGFLGTPVLLQALSDNGYTDLAYTLLLSKECPSWLYPLSKGATTVWEKWDAIRPDNSVQATSFNHFAYGAVGQWMYEHIAGIQAAAPGYEKIIIHPLIGSGLTWAEGSYQSAYGTIKSRWEIKKHRLHLRVTIPKGTTATIYLPSRVPGDMATKNVTAGNYHYSIQWN